MQSALWVLVGVAIGVVGVGLWRLWRGKSPSEPQLHHSIEQIRQVGQLVVLRMYLQQIVTAEQHIAGRWKNLMKWLVDSAKVALVIEYDVEVFYDLQDPKFQIHLEGPNQVRFVLPPCRHRTNIRKIQFYDERQARWLPWLLGDITAVLGPGISEEQKNQLIEAAQAEVEQKAQQLVLENRGQIANSVRQTLQMLAQGFQMDQVQVQFSEQEAAAHQEVASS